MLMFEVGAIPFENLRGEQVTTETWKQLLDVVKMELTANCARSIGIIVHSATGPGTTSKFVYNATFLKKLEDNHINVDKGIHMKVAGRGTVKRKPRCASLARHRNAKKDDQNLFTWAIEDLQIGDLDPWGLQVPGTADMARVQNPDSLRERDVLEGANMSKRERLELLGIHFYETFVEHFLPVGLKVDAFVSGRKRKSMVKKEEPEEGEDNQSGDDDLDDGDDKMESGIKLSTPAAKKRKSEGSVATGISPPAHASAASTNTSKQYPMLFVMLGGGNGNSAIGFLNSAMVCKRAHMLVADSCLIGQQGGRAVGGSFVFVCFAESANSLVGPRYSPINHRGGAKEDARRVHLAPRRGASLHSVVSQEVDPPDSTRRFASRSGC